MLFWSVDSVWPMTEDRAGERAFSWARHNSTTNSVRESEIFDFAANMTTSVPDTPTLTAVTIELSGLDWLHGPLLTAGFRQIHGILPSIRESHSFQKMRRL